MITVSIARRYARALLDLAAEQNALEPVGQTLDAVARAFHGSTELRDLMVNPAVTPANRQAVLAQILGKLGAHPLAVNLLRLMVDRGRAIYIEATAREYAGMLDARLGRLHAKVTSAVPLDAAALEKIRAQLTAVTARKVTVEAHVDPALLGGVVAQVGSMTFDGSLSTQLQSLRRDLLA